MIQKSNYIYRENNMESKTKSGFVSIIGRPNVGKSTLMNKIIGQKIAITSSKPQTTRNKISTVYTKGNVQMVFVDTPGLHKAKNKLGETMVSQAKRTFNESDVCLYLTEADPTMGEQPPIDTPEGEQPMEGEDSENGPGSDVKKYSGELSQALNTYN